MINGPVLVTERLILRPPGADDLDGWAAMAAEADTMEYIGGVAGRAGSWRQLCTMVGAWHISGFAMFSVIERETGAWIGRIGPWRPEGWPGSEVGWGIRAGFAGKGYAHEAAVAAMDFAVDILGWERIIHVIDPANTRSIALARRLGSANLGPTRLPDPYADVRVGAWGQTADQWRAHRRDMPA